MADGWVWIFSRVAEVVLVREKFAGVLTPVTLAATMYVPGVVFAVNATATATPVVSVVAVVCPAANVPLGPLGGAANVTNAPGTGLLPESRTTARKFVAKEVLTAAL